MAVLGALSALALVVVSVPAAAQDGRELDVRVLVISTGSAQTDAALDLIDDVLVEVGVAFDVLDSSAEELTSGTLVAGSRGLYNGIVITDADLFLEAGVSGFTDAEWKVLHDYERDFGVREVIISGPPVGTSSSLRDYGLANVGSGADFSASWVGPAGSEFFGYVNTLNDLAVTDFAFLAAARDDGVGPTVTPLLVNSANTEQILISYLEYDDGREAMLSTIASASFLIHSQVLAYGFVNFATRGLHLGAQRVYLNAHIDDLFLESDTWDAQSNTSSDAVTYRNGAGDIETTLAAQQKLLEEHPLLEQFKVDFAFNAFGSGAMVATDFETVADTTLVAALPERSYGGSGVLRASGRTARVILAQFDMSGLATDPGAVFGLRLVGSAALDTTAGTICRVVQEWNEDEATWARASRGEPWAGSAGVAVDDGSCVSFTVGDGTDAVAINDLVAAWQSGEPNYGLAIAVDGSYSTAAREAGVGVALTHGVHQFQPDPLTQRVLESADSFRFLNHTYSHLDMDVSHGTTEEQAFAEIDQNFESWRALGLPGLEENLQTVVTGEHSGLADNNGTVLDLSDDVHFPDGANPGLLNAVEANGVRFLASDASRPGQAQEAFVEDRDIVLLPRYPTGVFFNVLTPDQLTDEYNWIFYESYQERGEDPCEVPAAICQPRSYDEVVTAETVLGLRHMLTYRSWPHYFHITNIADYDGQGSTLLFDWLDAVLDRYEAVFKLPVLNPAFHEIGDRTERRIDRRASAVEAVLDSETGQVTLTADADVVVEVTGLASGAPYGPSLIAEVALLADEPRTFDVVPGSISALGDLEAASIDPARNERGSGGSHRLSLGDGRESLLRFDTGGLGPTVEAAWLRLPGVRLSGAASDAEVEVCLISEPWVADEVTWSDASVARSWSSSGGAVADPAACVTETVVEGRAAIVDVTTLVSAWADGATNNGLVLRSDGSILVSFDSPVAQVGPTLVVDGF